MPAREAIWIKGRSWYCDAPKRFHGKPENMRVMTISSPTQRAAPDKAQRLRCSQAGASAPLGLEPGPADRGLNSQTQVAGKIAMNALRASHPAAGPSGIPCHRYGMANSQ